MTDFNWFKGGKALLPVAFMYIPALLSSPDWMQRHAGLMAIAAIAEGTHNIMEKELGKVVGYVVRPYESGPSLLTYFFSLVTPMFRDPHPRVRFAACQCLCVIFVIESFADIIDYMYSRGQLCTDLEVGSFHHSPRYMFPSTHQFQEVIQDRYHEEIFSALIPTLQAVESRFVSFYETRAQI